MSKSRDKNGIWWHENNAGEKKKLLLNSPTDSLDSSATSPFNQSSNFSAIYKSVLK